MPIRYSQWTDEDGAYYYDEDAAENACDFFPEYLRLFEGEWAGQPFNLMDWQRLIIRNAFGWKRTSDGTRRCRLLYIWIPRKNTKSTLGAGIALLLVMGDAEPHGQVYTIARTSDQAKIVFNFASQFVDNSPQLRTRITPFKKSLLVNNLMGVLRWLSGKPAGKHGLNASGIVGDEIHEWASDELYTYVHQSEGTRRQPMDVLISTAGQEETVGHEHFKMCEAILNGEIHAPDTFVYIAAADPKQDADDPNYWALDSTLADANPGYGITVKPEFLRSEADKAKTNKRKVNDVKRYYLNLWVSQASVWLDMAKWDRCAWREREGQVDRSGFPMMFRDMCTRWRDLPELMRGRRCHIGVDLSSTIDLTCKVCVFPPDEIIPIWIVVPTFYLPRGSDAEMEARIKRDAFDYVAAEQIGAITLTDGDVVDYDVLRADILADAERYQVEAIAIDRWNATQIATQLAENGLNVALYGQGYKSMSGPSKFLERIMIDRKLDHGGHPVLRGHARRVAILKDSAENIKPAKDKSAGRIDGIVATVMGIGISDDWKTERSVYETRGLR